MKTLLTVLLERAIRRYLQLDPDSLHHMAQLTGKVIQVEMIEPDITLFLLPYAGGIRVRSRYEHRADAIIRGSLFALLCASAVSRDEALALRDRIQLSGDIELAQTFTRIIRDISADWEEPLARFIGDSLAHQVGNAVRGVNRWRKNTTSQLSTNFSDYLQEGLRILPPRAEVEEFYSAVFRLRHDVERLAAKIAILLEQEEASTS